MALPQIDTHGLIDFLVRLLNTPSPTGYAEQAIELVEKELSAYAPLEMWRTRKGALVARWEVQGSTAPRALTAHVDTLGAMVKEIKPNGRLTISRIGGLLLNAVETEGCWVFTSRGGKLRGSLLVDAASGHVHGAKASETPRSEEHMEIRLDARTTSAKETRSLDVAAGDFVAFDPRVEVTNDFIRSRHLDDKACVATIVAAVKALSDAGASPRETTYFHIRKYEIQKSRESYQDRRNTVRSTADKRQRLDGSSRSRQPAGYRASAACLRRWDSPGRPQLSLGTAVEFSMLLSVS